MRRVIATGTILGCMVLRATAQLGLHASECAATYGTPISDRALGPGIRCITISNAQATIEISLVDDVAQRVVYSATRMEAADIQRYLDANQGGGSWVARDIGDGSAQNPAHGTWLRSDNGAMAQLEGERLSLIAAAWHLAAEREQPAAVAPPAAEPVAVTTSAVSRVNWQEVLRGSWESAGDPQTVITLQFTPGIVFLQRNSSSAEPVSARYRYRERHDVAGMSLELVDVAAPRDNGPATVRAVLQVPDEHTLHYAATGATVPPLAVMGSAAEVVFHPVEKLQVHREGWPAQVPAKGDSRQQVLELLGKPKGQMGSGNSEVLFYKWGRVILANGNVMSVE